MNFQGLENASNRLLKYTRELEQHESKLYNKSIQHILDCRDSLEEALSIINNVLSSHTVMVDSSPADNICCNSDDVQLKSSNRHHMSEISVPSTDTHLMSNSTITNHPDGLNKRNALLQYVDVISKLPSLVSKYEQPYQCAILLNTWLDNRFSKGRCPSRGYNLIKIGEWVENILIAYGYYYQYGGIHDFIHKFTSWCNSVDTDDPYMLPYDVFKYSKRLQPSDFNRCSIGLQEIFKYLGNWRDLYSQDLGEYAMNRRGIRDRYMQCIIKSNISYDPINSPMDLITHDVESIVMQCKFTERK